MIYLSREVQSNLQATQHALFGVASFLNLISLYCLIKETPPHQAKIRNFLLMTQVMVVVNGIYTDILMEPIPLFPAIAGICTGILCRSGLPPHLVLGGLIVTYIWLGAAILFCCIFRHQALLPQESKLSKTKSRILVSTALSLSVVPTVTYSSIPFDSTRIAILVNTSRFDIGWVPERGPYFIHENGDLVLFFIALLVTLVTAVVIVSLLIFFHMFYVLQRDKTRSDSTKRKIRKSLFILFTQLIIPFFLLALPAIILFSGLLCECIPFEATISIFSLMIIHPLVHNIILLGITPTYRAIIKSFPRKLRKVSQTRRGAIVNTVSTVLPRRPRASSITMWQ